MSTANRLGGPKALQLQHDETLSAVDAAGEEVEVELVLARAELAAIKTAVQSLDSKTPDTAVDLALGRLFTAGGMVAIAAAGTGTFHLTNPDDSGRVVTLQQFTLATNTLARCTFWVDTTPPAGATTVASFNNNRASANPAKAVARRAAAAGTGGTQLSSEYLLPNGIPVTQAFPLVLAPGQSISCRVTTGLTQAMDFFCSATWSEDAL